ncbi:flagellar hook-length control protein FliK [Vibrio sp. 99-8-1]|uniref:flagellar hook-length control protein FliK n=1 Tax=Vibrio sp. 99-8-1 TaxID=2607602 RepID=UPI001493406A|nr:flagellar hook-length control protein FliK [Vibrio sp. 99-8-1]NOI65560.1 hypothetical protein [Vibrio sp. 99-8-1]
MNQSSLSISDMGKSNTLLQVGAGESKTLPDSEESGSFLSTLGALFQSDEKGGEEVKTDKLSSVSSESGTESVDELIDAGDEVEEGEGSEKLSKKQQIDEASVDATTLSDDEAVANGDASSKVATDKSVLDKTITEPDKAAKAMSEGNELLGRLDESKQVLNPTSGKPLPPSASINAESADIEADVLQKYINGEGATDKSSIDAPASQLNKTMSASGSAELNIKATDVTDANSATLGQQANNPESIGQANIHQDNAEPLLPTQSSTVSNSEKVPIDLDQLKGENSKDQTIAWGAAGLTGAAVVSQQATNGTLASEVEQSVGSLSPESGSAASMDALVSDGTAVGELSALSLEDEVQAPINWSNTVVEQSKAPIDGGKVATSSASTAMASNQLLQSAAAQQPLSQQAQLAGAEKLASAAAAPVMNADASVMQAATPFNPMQLNSANNAQGQALKAALAGGGLLAGAKMATGDKSDAKESALSQQLSGLASQQGAQQAQLKTDMQQAVAQSPLQLSREAAGEKLSEQVQMMMSKNLKNVDIRLDPPELGRMQIRMTMNNDIASVQFTVSNPQARDLVEQAMPRLREMLAQQGVQLSDSSVHQQSAGQQQQYAAGNGSGGSEDGRGNLTDEGSNLDESINLDLNIAAKDDGISYYA